MFGNHFYRAAKGAHLAHPFFSFSRAACDGLRAFAAFATRSSRRHQRRFRAATSFETLTAHLRRDIGISQAGPPSRID